MQAFWRTEPLSQAELELIGALGEAHNKSSFRQCPSTVALQCGAQGSGDLCRSLAAALATLGGRHGPIEETYDFIHAATAFPNLAVEHSLKSNRKVPGWGSSFVEVGHGDPVWKPFDDLLLKSFEFHRRKLLGITLALHDSGVMIDPNPSAYTALTAIILGMPKKLAPYLLVIGRLSAWAEIFMNEVKGT